MSNSDNNSKNNGNTKGSFQTDSSFYLGKSSHLSGVSIRNSWNNNDTTTPQKKPENATPQTPKKSSK